MSTTTGEPRRLNKKLILAGAAVLLLLILGGGGATWYLMHQQAAARAAAQGDDDEAGEAATAETDARREGPPVFVPLDTFTVNLADGDGQRYAQVGITLEVADSEVAEQVKVYMPAIRNNILMVLAHKTSVELLEREGKQRLVDEVLREATRPLGAEAGKKAAGADHGPLRAIHFSSFIVQ